MYTIIASLFVFGILVFFHEFGHFIVAKKSDIYVKEFSLGMGPSIAKIRAGETEYTVRLFPLGGYVKMEGEDTKSHDPRAFGNKPLFNRFSVIFAGPLMNLILAAILISIISFFAGITTTRVTVLPGEPAQKAGIKNGDIIYAVDGKKIDTWEEVVSLISIKPEEIIELTVKRHNKLLDYSIKTNREPETNRGVIGIKSHIIKYSPFESIKCGVEKTLWASRMVIEGLIQIIAGKAKADVVGPVGIVHMVGEAAQISIYNLLYLAAIISINLGVFNLLPIPALDGSRLFFLIIEMIRGKPIDPDKEGFIHFVGFALLMMMMVAIAYKDIMRFNLF